EGRVPMPQAREITHTEQIAPGNEADLLELATRARRRSAPPITRPRPRATAPPAGSEVGRREHAGYAPPMNLVGHVAVTLRPEGARAAQLTLVAVADGADNLALLAPEGTHEVLSERLRLIGSSLTPRRYADARFVAERLHRMTAGRRRIELRVSDVDAVAAVL